MESAATAQGFINSVEDTGLIYSIMISDGDTSKCLAVDQALPYLKVIEKDIKEVINNSGEAAVAAINRAVVSIKMTENLTWIERMRAMTEKIKILPRHIFGDHSECFDSTSDSCKGPKKNEVNYVPEMIVKNLFQDIQDSFFRAERNIESLRYDETTNACESFNALIVKCIGYKGTNFAKKKGYRTRCHVASLQWNEKKTLAAFCNIMKKDVPSIGRKVQLNRAELVSEKHARKQQVADLLIPVNKFLKMQEEENYHQSPSEDIQITQDVDSSTSPIYRGNNDEISNLLIESLNSEIAMEVVVKRILKDKYGYTIQPYGLVLDSTVLGIRASPDGIIDRETIVEIKSSFTGMYLPVDEVLKDKTHNISKSFKNSKGKFIVNEKHEFYY
ncbi:hypothetical protein TKK_0016545 [Trichogramma kaykai]